MRYKISEIQDQILATFTADTTNFSNVWVKPYTGQCSAQMFLNAEYMQGFKALLPFTLVSYQGRVARKMERDASGMYYIHSVKFRIYAGAKSANTQNDAERNCFDMLSAIYDDLHGKVPLVSPQQLSSYTALSGTALSSTGVSLQSPFMEAEGTDEVIVINLPGIVVYQTDYEVRLIG